MEFEKGKIYKTRGGWEAECIHDAGDHCYCVHRRPKETFGEYELRFSGDEYSFPILHNHDGSASGILVVHVPPTYYGHPADLMEE